MEINIPQELIEEAIKNEVEQQVKEYFNHFEKQDVLEGYCIAYAEKEFENTNQKKIDRAIEEGISTYFFLACKAFLTLVKKSAIGSVTGITNSPIYYQLDFLIPGISPLRAISLKTNLEIPNFL